MRTLVTFGLLLALFAAACGSRTGLSIGDRSEDAAVVDRDVSAPSRCSEFGADLALVTVTPAGTPSEGGAGTHSLSSDGRYVAFVTSAGDLVEGDSNDELDVFVRDRRMNTTVRASVSTEGVEGDDASGYRLITGRPALTSDGGMVAFPSNSDLLDPSDEGRTDMFVRTLASEQTSRLQFADGVFRGGDAPVFVSGGRYLVFGAIAVFELGVDAATVQVVRFDLVTNEYVIASVAEDGSYAQRPDRVFDGSWGSLLRVLSVSADGNLVAFAAETPAFDTTPDRHADIFVRDIAAGSLTEITALANDDSFAPDLSADGRLVAFNSSATNIGGNTSVYVFDRDTATYDPIPDAEGFPSMSDDGRHVTFVRERRAWVFDRTTRRDAPLTPPLTRDDEIQLEPFVSRDGCWVSFGWSVGSDSQVWVARNPLR